MRWRCGGLLSEGWGGLLCGGDVRRRRGCCYVGMIGSVGTGWWIVVRGVLQGAWQ